MRIYEKRNNSMEEKVTITIYTESLMQSIVADASTFLMLGGAFWVNAHYIQSKMFAAIIVIMLMIKFVAYIGNRKNVFTSRAEAVAFIQKRK